MVRRMDLCGNSAANGVTQKCCSQRSCAEMVQRMVVCGDGPANGSMMIGEVRTENTTDRTIVGDDVLLPFSPMDDVNLSILSFRPN